MRFLVDAQLPRRFCFWIEAAGHDALHTLDLPRRNLTSDDEIINLAEREDIIVITKDDDFGLIRSNLGMIAEAFETSSFVEVGRDSMVIHE